LQENSDEKFTFVGYVGTGGKDISVFTKNSKAMFVWPGSKLCKAKHSERDDYGNLVIHLTNRQNREEEDEQSQEDGSNVIENESLSETSADVPINPRENEKHFVCSNKSCRNSCSRIHSSTHCRGFSFVNHNCSHHCGPGPRCFSCKAHVTKLYQCNQCNWRLCKSCCFIQN
ncbi:unnamed protein product, partial [Adineta ricciae]